MDKKAVVLLSGGLDSATTLAIAHSQGYLCYALSFDYGQRHNSELDSAQVIAKNVGVIDHQVVKIDLSQFGGSALTDLNMEVPETPTTGIPITYVPARNTIFLSMALAWAEVTQSNDIFIGVNAVDYSGYPDCRPEYITAFQAMANLATQSAVEGQPLHIHTPLINLTKAKIIRKGLALNVDYALTRSCYSLSPAGEACGRCDSCRIRREGFSAAGVSDPTVYRSEQ